MSPTQLADGSGLAEEPEQPARVFIEVECWRCAGVSTRPLPEDSDGPVFDPEYVHPCPHCFREGHLDDYRLGRYDLLDVAVRPAGGTDPDSTRGIDSIRGERGPLYEIEWEDFKAVRIEGQGYAERARERGVTLQTVWDNVQRAIERLEGEGGDDR